VIVGITGGPMLKPPPQPDITVKNPAVKRRVAKPHAIRRDIGWRPVLAISILSKKTVSIYIPRRPEPVENFLKEHSERLVLLDSEPESPFGRRFQKIGLLLRKIAGPKECLRPKTNVCGRKTG
jgi:hypothetical protein